MRADHSCRCERLACHRAQSEYIVEFAVGQQSSVGRDHGAAKLHHQATVKIQPDSGDDEWTICYCLSGVSVNKGIVEQ
jgi:hypothetical protein